MARPTVVCRIAAIRANKVKESRRSVCTIN
uniref:Uncharacterized protein n=1 Tax=Anguilla anguilla TaxID=7936 RepID=A0A0E9VU42_ANGAN